MSITLLFAFPSLRSKYKINTNEGKIIARCKEAEKVWDLFDKVSDVNNKDQELKAEEEVLDCYMFLLDFL